MKTIKIETSVKNPEVVKAIEKFKSNKKKIHELLSNGVHISDIPDELKVKFSF